VTAPADLDPDTRDRLVRRFRRFADEEAPAVGSPLYARLAAGVARHDELLAVLAGAPERQQRPTTFFAAVHDVLLRGVDHPLREHYPRLAARANAPTTDPVDDVRDLVRRHGDELRRLVSERGTQTNEVLRAVALAPALATVAHGVGRPLSLLEVGPSAGLVLRLDRYGYRYRAADGTETAVAGELELASEVRHGGTPPAHLLPPPVLDRLGLDRAPVDVTDEDDVRWLRACVWPEHLERAERLDAALELAREDPPRLVRGDMLDDLRAAAASLDPDGHLVIVHCVALMYLAPARRQAWRDHVAELSREGPVDVIAFEDHRIEPYGDLFPADLPGADGVHGIVARSSYRAGEVSHTLLGRAHMHGRWVGWA
jgi:hypothetical protein